MLRKKPPGKVLASAHAVDREFRIISALGKLSEVCMTTMAMHAACCPAMWRTDISCITLALCGVQTTAACVVLPVKTLVN